MKKAVLLGTTLILVGSTFLTGCSNDTQEAPPNGKTVTLNPSATATFYDEPVVGYKTPTEAVQSWVSNIQAKKYSDVCTYMTTTGVAELNESFKARSCVDNLELYAKKFYVEPVKVVQVRVNPQTAMNQDIVELSIAPNSNAYVAVDNTKATVSVLPSLHYDKQAGWQYGGYSN